MIVKVLQEDDGLYGSCQYFEGEYVYKKLDKFDNMESSSTISILKDKEAKPEKVVHIILHGKTRVHIRTDCKAYLMNEQGNTIEHLN